MNLKAMVWGKRALQILLWGSVKTCTGMFHQFLRASFAACLSACVFLVVSCRPHHDRLEDALRMAGDNRAELERVLYHYADDSLKLEAARFLIGNMPVHYSYEGALLDTLYAAFEQFHDSGAYDKKRFSCLQPFPYKKLSRVSDLVTVTADYLIENIEYSFKVWRERPWGKHIPFDRFCELILPYRIKDEPLTRWKKAFYEKYTPILDSLYTGTDVVEACTRLNHYLNGLDWHYIKELHGPHPAADWLERYRTGDCEAMSDYAVYIMRAVGLPVAKDTYFHAPDQLYGHCWNALLDTTGVMLSFFNETADPQRGKQVFYTKGKVHRYGYAVQHDRLQWLAEGFHVPSPLNDFTLRDVSADYFPTGEIRVDCSYVPSDSPRPVYMAVFAPWGWIPSGIGEYRDGTACFHDVEPGFYYATLYYDDAGKAHPAGPAFKLDAETGEVLHLSPDGKEETLVLRRKYPMAKRRYGFLEHMKGGRFEAADRSDFGNAVTLYRIDTVPGPKLYDIALATRCSYRYYRYVSSEGNSADIAELYWLNGGDTLRGTPVHSRPEKETDEFRPGNAWDGDRLTYFNSADAPGWIGMDFGKPVAADRLLFMPRNDDNYITPGHTYELFYWSREGWKSLGRKVADGEQLVYRNAPRHALFWLRDRTAGKEEQTFVYFNGKQYFNKREIIY